MNFTAFIKVQSLHRTIVSRGHPCMVRYSVRVTGP